MTKSQIHHTAQLAVLNAVIPNEMKLEILRELIQREELAQLGESAVTAE